MTDIIDFLQIKNKREEQLIKKSFQKGNSLDEKLEALLKDKALKLHDHQLFLAFLTYAQTNHIEVKQLFQDVIRLPKHQFELQYNMNWSQVTKLAATFLSILQQSAPTDYEAFRASLRTT